MSLTRLSLLVAMCASGCGFVTGAQHDNRKADFDADGDGFISALLDGGDDCDDTNGSISPGAPELCDDVDNNCDGGADDDEGVDAPFWYSDNDGDGWGDNSTFGIQRCAQPEQTADNNRDCDDADADVNPDASETCNDIDDNCNHATDEGVLTTFYEDVDEDGYGDADRPIRLCEAIAGVADNDSDCDDARNTRYPGATEQSRCDMADTDCDGALEELTVPGDYASIQAAIDDAPSGASDEPYIVCVGPGDWGRVDFDGKDVQLLSSQGPDDTTLDGGGVGRVVSIPAGTPDSAILAGFTITGGKSAYGAGVYVEDSDPTLVDLKINGNEASTSDGSCGGAAIYLNNSDAAVIGALITDNDAFCKASSIGRHEMLGAAGIGSVGGQPLLLGVGVVNNRCEGVWEGLPGDPLFQIIALHGCALGLKDSAPFIANMLIAQNEAVLTGTNAAVLAGMIFAAGPAGSNAMLENVTISHNRAISSGPAFGMLTHANDGILSLTNVDISSNQLTAGPGGTVPCGGDIMTYEEARWPLATGTCLGEGGSFFIRTSNLYNNTPPDPEPAVGWLEGASGNIEEEPLYIDIEIPGLDFRLQPGSPLIDAGMPTISDVDGSKSDIGAYGGPAVPEIWQ